mgnify:CR=1 FL=1
MSVIEYDNRHFCVDNNEIYWLLSNSPYVIPADNF